MLEGWIALTGSPGAGKSTLADALRLHGVLHVDLARFAFDYGLVEGVDAVRNSNIIDPAKVGPRLHAFVQKGTPVLLESHWSHDIPGVQSAIVLRLKPSELKKRLVRRGWPPKKVRENLEAEGTDIILQEAISNLGVKNVFEIDATGRSVDAIKRDAYALIKGPNAVRSRFKPGKIDWSDDLIALR